MNYIHKQSQNINGSFSIVGNGILQINRKESRPSGFLLFIISLKLTSFFLEHLLLLLFFSDTRNFPIRMEKNKCRTNPQKRVPNTVLNTIDMLSLQNL